MDGPAVCVIMASVVSVGLKKNTILLIEDDLGVRAVISDALRMEGYPIAEAGNGAEALRWLAHHPPPGLILLDLCMPVMDGAQFRAQQLRDPALRDIPVVVISGSEERLDSALKGEPFVPKPVDLYCLLRQVERCGI